VSSEPGAGHEGAFGIAIGEMPAPTVCVTLNPIRISENLPRVVSVHGQSLLGELPSIATLG
jgi:hypothetical protein